MSRCPLVWWTSGGSDPARRMPCDDWSGDGTLGAWRTQWALRSRPPDPSLLSSSSDGSGAAGVASTRALSHRRADHKLCSPLRAAARVALRAAVGGAPVNVVVRVDAGGVRERLGSAEPDGPPRAAGAGTDAWRRSALDEAAAAAHPSRVALDTRDELGDPRDDLGRHDSRRGASRRYGSGIDEAVKMAGSRWSAPAIGSSDLAPWTHTAGSAGTPVLWADRSDGGKPSLRFTLAAEARTRSDRVGANGSRRRRLQLSRIVGQRQIRVWLGPVPRMLAHTQHKMHPSPTRALNDTVKTIVIRTASPPPGRFPSMRSAGSTQQISHPRSV